MSREDVKELERFYEAFNAAGDVESLLPLVHPEFVYRTREEFPGGGSFGLDAAVERISALRELFDDIRWEPQEFLEAGDRIVVAVRQTGRGHTSGVDIDQSITHVWLIDDGRARELRVYSRREEALEAVGLRQ
jgi:ketosteroid isomerase-like protein